jgi:protein involved in polysaccharide export with SLBB domain
MQRVLIKSIGVAALLLTQTSCGSQQNDQSLVAAPQAAIITQPLYPGDLLDITVAGEDELDGRYVVQEDHTVALPLIGSVDAVGADLPTFKERLRQHLIASLFSNPTVTVTLAAHGPVADGLSPPPLRSTEGSVSGY